MKHWDIAIVAFVILLVAAGVVLFFSSDPPIGNTTVTDIDRYMKVEPYVRELMKKSYAEVLPASIPDDCAPEYYYSYQCNYDGDMYFTVYLRLDSMRSETFEAELRRLQGIPEARRSASGDAEYIILSLPELEEYFSESVSLRGFRFELAEIDESRSAIRYLISYQRDNQHIPAMLPEMLEGLRER